MYHGSVILTPLDFIPRYNIIQVSIFKTYILIQKVEDSRDILTFSFSVESIGIFFHIYICIFACQVSDLPDESERIGHLARTDIRKKNSNTLNRKGKG